MAPAEQDAPVAVWGQPLRALHMRRAVTLRGTSDAAAPTVRPGSHSSLQQVVQQLQTAACLLGSVCFDDGFNDCTLTWSHV